MQRVSFFAVFTALVVIVCSSTISTAEETFDQLFQRIPIQANAVMAIDVNDLQATSMAQKNGWFSKMEAAYADRSIFVPPEANRVLIASRLSPLSGFQQEWEVALMDLRESIPLKYIAQLEGGYVDTIAGYSAAWTPSGSYIAEIQKNLLAVIYPDDRQAVSKWLHGAFTGASAGLTSYLRQAVNEAGRTSPVVMAIDMKDMLQPAEVRSKIENAPAGAGRDLNQDELVATLLSLQGAVFTVSISDKAEGELRVDFGTDTKILKPVAKEMLTSVLSNLGVIWPGFSSWNVTTESYSVVARGGLDDGDLRRIFSLIETPTTKFSELNNEKNKPTSQEDQENLVKRSTLTYWRTLETLVEDLKEGVENSQRKKNNYEAVWFERYARKIDRMPILNVDDEMLAFGQSIAETFRSVALGARKTGIAGGVAKSQVQPYNVDGGYSAYYRYNNSGYGYGYGGANSGAGFVTGTPDARNAGDTARETRDGVRTLTSQRNQISTQVRANINVSIFQTGAQLEQAMSDMRVKMTKKYQIEF
ncbi:hypothetical protein [Calycomorphotria hydatis]|uniref:Uncharacterized protein n=1 Tax=Calycomorphotria hydatis TaxID=2528027 RepID=A0A517T468_9PLAN|nr:hypothetical protein [Calycomorphotria hydatis]QDT63176.1 hypothetical protein V22_03940 [Calycomorphotria hydatis]